MYLEAVEQFHTQFDMPVLIEPQIPNEDRCNLRINLLKEELSELEEAIEKGDLVGVADALGDLQYVLSGAILEFGMKSIFSEVFNEIHRSNMTKACDTEEEAIMTIHQLKDKEVDAFYLKKRDKFNIYRTNDFKTLKSLNYSPADLQQFLTQ